jgi:hypothetical protein
VRGDGRRSHRTVAGREYDGPRYVKALAGNEGLHGEVELVEPSPRGQHSTTFGLGRRLRDRLPPFRGWAAAGWSLIVVAAWKLLGEVVVNLLADVVKSSGWGWAQTAMDTLISWLWAAWNSPASSFVAIVVGFVILWFAPRRHAQSPVAVSPAPPAVKRPAMPPPGSVTPVRPAPGPLEHESVGDRRSPIIDETITPEYLVGLFEGRTAVQVGRAIADCIDAWIEVDGPLGDAFEIGDTVRVDFADRPTVSPVPRPAVSMIFHGDAAARVSLLSPGDQMVVRGQVKNVTRPWVGLDNCDLIDPPQPLR